jgi:hypothetical protein
MEFEPHIDIANMLQNEFRKLKPEPNSNKSTKLVTNPIFFAERKDSVLPSAMAPLVDTVLIFFKDIVILTPLE